MPACVPGSPNSAIDSSTMDPFPSSEAGVAKGLPHGPRIQLSLNSVSSGVRKVVMTFFTFFIESEEKTCLASTYPRGIA